MSAQGGKLIIAAAAVELIGEVSTLQLIVSVPPKED